MRLVVAAALLITFAAAPAAAQPTREDREALRHLRLGQEHLRAEHWDTAETEFKAAITIDPLLELAHYGLGQSYMGMKRFAAAVAAFTECRAAFHAQAGRAAVGQLQNEARVSEQLRQLQDQRAQMQSQNFKGSPLQAPAIARLDSMISELRSRRFHDAQSGPPQTPPWISIALGSAYFRGGSNPDAEHEYLEALKADPKLGEAHNNLAVVYMVTGRYPQADDAIKAAEKAGFRVNPQLKEDLKKQAAAKP